MNDKRSGFSVWIGQRGQCWRRGSRCAFLPRRVCCFGGARSGDDCRGGAGKRLCRHGGRGRGGFGGADVARRRGGFSASPPRDSPPLRRGSPASCVRAGRGTPGRRLSPGLSAARSAASPWSRMPRFSCARAGDSIGGISFRLRRYSSALR